LNYSIVHLLFGQLAYKTHLSVEYEHAFSINYIQFGISQL
jgi:hypothetical protein